MTFYKQDKCKNGNQVNQQTKETFDTNSPVIIEENQGNSSERLAPEVVDTVSTTEVILVNERDTVSTTEVITSSGRSTTEIV